MSLRLITGEDNVTQLPVGNLTDMPAMARRFAEDLEAGQWGKVSRVLALVEHEDGLCILGWGEGANSYEMMGLLEAAKLRVFADDLIED